MSVIAVLVHLTITQSCWSNFMLTVSDMSRRHNLTANSLILWHLQSFCSHKTIATVMPCKPLHRVCPPKIRTWRSGQAWTFPKASMAEICSNNVKCRIASDSSRFSSIELSSSAYIMPRCHMSSREPWNKNKAVWGCSVFHNYNSNSQEKVI